LKRKSRQKNRLYLYYIGVFLIFLRIAALLAMTKPTLATIGTGNEGMTAVCEMTSSCPAGMAKIAAMNLMLISGAETVVTNHDFSVARAHPTNPVE
jgi:hypothetical protein